MAERARPLALRIAKVIGKILIGIVLAVGVLFAAALLALRIPAVQTEVSARTNAALENLFQGRLKIERLGRVDLSGLQGAKLRVFDPAGRKVLEADGVRVDLFWLGLVWQAVVERPAVLSVNIEGIRIDHVELRLIDDGTGTPTLARAFEPAEPSPPSEPGTGTRVSLPKIELRHAWVHGAVGGSPPIDAELRDMQAALQVELDRTELEAEIERLWVRALPGQLDPDGKLSAKLSLPSGAEKKPAAQAEFEGRLARAETRARFRLDGERLEAKVEADDIGPRSFEAFAPDIQPSSPLKLRAEASGTLSALRFRLETTGGPGRIEARGDAQLAADTVIRAEVDVSDFDLAGLLADGPKSDLNVQANLEARLAANGTLNGTYRVTSSAGKVSGIALPVATFAGTLNTDASGALNGRGTADIAEPGTATQLSYLLQKVGTPEGLVEASGIVRVNDPPRMSHVASARGVVRLQARFRPARSTLEASATADLSNLRAPGVGARRVELRAAASGPVENPRLEARVLAEDVAAADRRITRVQATARGTQQELELAVEATGQKPDRLRARTRLGLAPELSLRETEIRIEDGKDLAITVTAAAVELSGGSIRVQDLGLRGAGEARASLTWTGRLSRMELVTQDLQPVRILKAVGVDSPIEAASLTMTAHYAEREAGPMGSISGSADEIRAEKLSDGVVRFDLALANRTLSGSLDASAQGAKIRIDADEIRIPNPPYDAGALERMDGALTASGQIDLTQMESLLTELLPIASSEGKITFGLQASRPRGGNQGPRIQASIDTANLRITGQRQTERQPGSAHVARATKPWSIERIDLRGDAEVDAGAGVARLEATLKDKEGELFTLRAGATPEPTRSLRTLLERDYTRVPLRVRLTMPPRALEKLPEIAQTQGLRGVAALDAALEGTLREPRLLADADVTCLATEEMKQTVDLSLSAEYEPGRGRLALDAASEGSSIAELRAKWEGDPAQLAGAPLESRQSPVQGELALRLTRFPLELIPPLSDQQIRGPMSGNVELKGFGKDARLTAKFQTDRVLVGTVGVQKFELSVDTEKDHLVGKLQIGGNNGLASAEIRAPFQWGSRVVPVVEERLEARLNAKNFRLETLAPLVAAQLSELEGRLDAAVEARLAGAQKPEVAGWAVVRRGVVHVPALGQRFRSIESRVSIDKGNVKLERLTARGVTGKLSVVGGAKLDGLSLQTAEAHVRIPRGDRIPVTIEGSAIGDAWGKIDVGVKVSERDRTTRIEVDVPEFTLEMPESNPAALQDLALPQDVRLGTRLPGGDFVTMPIQPLEEEQGGTSAAPSLTVVQVSLGRDVWLRKGQQVEVQVGGSILVQQKEQARISGKIELLGGTLDVQGKRFDIERGVVTFVGPDPANPTISAVARWDSPEGYTVYAEYTGTAQEGKLTLRSEPALTDNEILSLLMFGSPDGSFGSGEGGGTAQTAIGLAGGTAAQGLNRALSSITDLDVSARIDTSTGTARPELVVQLTPRVTARVTRAVGEPPTGQSPDRTFLTLDFRLQRAWSLSAMIGDRGASALDLIWRKRY